MSRDFNVYCRTCNEEHQFNDANWQEEMMINIVKHAALIAQLEVLNNECNIDLQTTYGLVRPDWFKKHLGHELVVRDEYGQISETCGEQFTCGECYIRHYCALKKLHDGKHKSRAAADK